MRNGYFEVMFFDQWSSILDIRIVASRRVGERIENEQKSEYQPGNWSRNTRDQFKTKAGLWSTNSQSASETMNFGFGRAVP